MCYVEVVIFISVRFGFYIKKIIKTDFFLKNKTETGSNRPVSVWFGYFGDKTGLARFSGLDRFFSGLAWLFSSLTWFFSVWLSFFRFGFSSVFSVLDL
jgi:hypothetical protein